MKFKQILEKRTLTTLLPENCQGYDMYFVNGLRVKKDVFKKQEKRICLKKETKEKNGWGAIYADKKITTIQYFPLPFCYKKDKKS